MPVAAFQCQFWASELGSRRSQPTLNQTGELKATFWLRSRWAELGEEGVGVFGGGEVAVADAPVADGLGDAGDEGADAGLALGGADLRPWRYLEATMLVAVMDQSAGTSTFFCSKMILPLKS